MSDSRYPGGSVCLLLPCLNEAPTLAKVVRDFRAEIPSLRILVFDNGSTDGSREIARREADELIVVREPGKGRVLQEMFRSVEADTYVLADCDDTYAASGLKEMLGRFAEYHADMVVATRTRGHADGAFRRFHLLGNQFVAWLINALFSVNYKDPCSGYRVLSRKLVKGLELRARGFEIEAELTVKAIIGGYKVCEMDIPYRARGKTSQSKFRTCTDGGRVILAILRLGLERNSKESTRR